MLSGVYLGDSVYACLNEANQIELKLDSHETPAVVVLEPEVTQKLIEFAKRVQGIR